MKTTTPVFPSLWDTLKAGLDLTTKHLWLILLPVLLDGLYWLGPRLSIRPVVESFMTLMIEQAAAPEQSASMIEQYEEFQELYAGAINLFSSLNLPLIGVPTLMSGVIPAQTPIQTTTIELDNVGLILLLVGLFSVVGLLLSIVYYSLVAQAVHEEGVHISWLWRKLPHQTMSLALMLMVIGLVGGIFFVPFFCLSLFASYFNITFAFLLAFVGMMPGMTLVLYSFFSPHGVLFYDRPPLSAIRESIALVRAHQSTAVSLFILLYLLSYGMTWLWRLADDGSWLTLVSIVGHGFVSTALAAATFIFYRDRYPTLTVPSSVSQES